MFTYDLKFLTTDESLHIKSNDLKTRKYETKKKQEETVHDAGKRSYCERRGEKWRASRPRQIRKLETILRERSIILCEWSNSSLITLVFSSGALAYLTVNPDSLEVNQILFDKYCVGKLSGQPVTSAVLSKSHLLFLHSERVVTLVTFNVPRGTLDTTPTRIADRNPHLQIIELVGGARRAERRMSWCDSSSGLQVLAWSTNSSEPAPWSPISEDRANLHLYYINGTQISLIGYHQLEHETLSAELSQEENHTVHIVEQITYQMNGVSLEWVRYEAPPVGGATGAVRALRRTDGTRALLPAAARAVRRAGARLLAVCLDGTLHVLHCTAGLTHSTRAAFIASEVWWAGALVLAAEEGGRLQSFDHALSLLQHHTKCIHLAHHFREPRRMAVQAARPCRGGSALLVSFSGGPLALLRIIHPQLPMGWVRCGRVTLALSLLRALPWSETSVRTLQALVATALRRPVRADTETAAQLALGAYLAPATPLPPAATRYAPLVHDLARKFFHHLLRRGRLDKALSLAVDLRAADLFADVRWAALRAGRDLVAHEAHDLALHCAHTPDSSCSESCSQCSSSASSYSVSDDERREKDTKVKAPPLPRVPPPAPHPTMMPVPLTANEPASTNSIRPNLHQYLERDLTIWNTDAAQPTIKRNGYSPDSTQNLPSWPNTQPNNSRNTTLVGCENSTKWRLKPNQPVMDTVQRTHNERFPTSQFGKVFQAELKQETPSSSYSSNMYRYHNDVNMVSDRDASKHERIPAEAQRTRLNGEKNKVKFSDTVTIAVVSEERSLVQARAARPQPALQPAENPAASKTGPKIKVVHFGMV